MGFFEFRVLVKCPVATAFAIYTDTDAWQRCTVVTGVEWIGNPWEEGSRMRVKSQGVVPVTSDQVLLHFESPSRIAYMSHFLGITFETRLTFLAASDQETQIHFRGEFVGAGSRTFGFALGPAIERGTRDFMEGLNRECERVAALQLQPNRPAQTSAEEGSAEGRGAVGKP